MSTCNSTASTTADVIFTLAAAKKVWELMVEEENLNLKLRAFVTGGGCSGLQYGFTFEEQINDDDTVITVSLLPEDKEAGHDGKGSCGESRLVQLLIDPMSFQYLMGAEIDYKEDIEGAQFVIRNPNAKTSCGCGSSFSV